MFFCLSLLFFSLAPFCGSNLQAAQLYTISETQLNQLDKNLQTLEQHNKEKQVILEKQEEQLTEANKQLQIARMQIENSKKENEQIRTSLEKAETSFSQYEKTAEHKLKVKTRQRNLWIVISAIFGTIAITK
jgi:septal ring factor EnvC (AmiA/AmiB activator)